MLYCSTSVTEKLKRFVTRDSLCMRYGYMCAGDYACESHMSLLLLFCRNYWHYFLRQGLLLKLLFPYWVAITKNLSVYASPTLGLWHMAWHLVLNFAQQILYYRAVFLVPACGITYLSRVTLHYINHIIIHGSLLFHKTLLVQANIAWLLLIGSDYLWVYLLIVWLDSKFW